MLSSPKKLQKRIKEKFEWANNLEKKYLDIFQYQHFDWTLAASYRIGSIWENFAEKLYNAPVPRQFRNDDIMMDEWKVLLEQQAEPFEQRAVQKYGQLVTEARKKKFRNDWTKRALQSLNRYARDEWPIEKEAITSGLEALLPGALFAQPVAYRTPPAPEPAPAPAEPSEDKSEEKSEDKSEDKSEEKSEDKSEEKSEDKSEEKSEDKSEDKSEEKSEEKSEDKPEDKSDSAIPAAGGAEEQPAVEVTPSDVPTPDQVAADQKAAEERSEEAPAPAGDDEDDK